MDYMFYNSQGQDGGATTAASSDPHAHAKFSEPRPFQDGGSRGRGRGGFGGGYQGGRGLQLGDGAHLVQQSQRGGNFSQQSSRSGGNFSQQPRQGGGGCGRQLPPQQGRRGGHGCLELPPRINGGRGQLGCRPGDPLQPRGVPYFVQQSQGGSDFPQRPQQGRGGGRGLPVSRFVSQIGIGPVTLAQQGDGGVWQQRWIQPRWVQQGRGGGHGPFHTRLDGGRGQLKLRPGGPMRVTTGKGGLYDCGSNAVYPQRESAPPPNSPQGTVYGCCRCGRVGHHIKECDAPRRFEGWCGACFQYGHRRVICKTLVNPSQRHTKVEAAGVDFSMKGSNGWYDGTNGDSMGSFGRVPPAPASSGGGGSGSGANHASGGTLGGGERLCGASTGVYGGAAASSSTTVGGGYSATRGATPTSAPGGLPGAGGAMFSSARGASPPVMLGDLPGAEGAAPAVAETTVGESGAASAGVRFAEPEIRLELDPGGMPEAAWDECAEAAVAREEAEPEPEPRPTSFVPQLIHKQPSNVREAPLSSEEGVEMDARPLLLLLLLLPVATAAMKEIAVTPSHGAASFVVVEDDKGAVDGSTRCCSDGSIGNGGEEDSSGSGSGSSSRGGDSGGRGSTSSSNSGDGAEKVEPVIARRGVDFPFDRGKAIAPRSSPQLQRSRQRGGEEVERRRCYERSAATRTTSRGRHVTACKRVWP